MDEKVRTWRITGEVVWKKKKKKQKDHVETMFDGQDLHARQKKTMLTLQVMVFLVGLLHKSYVVVVMCFVIWLLF